MGFKPRTRAPNNPVQKPVTASPEAALRRAIRGAKTAANQKKITTELIEKWGERIGALKPTIRVAIKDPTYGILGHFDFLPERAEIKREFGTGKFKLIVYRPNEKNSLVYATCKTVVIS